MEVSKKQGLLKFRLLHNGVYIPDDDLASLFSLGYRVPSTDKAAIIRTGASFGIEAIVDSSICVNIPRNMESSICFSEDFSKLKENGQPICDIGILKNPISASVSTENGETVIAAKTCFDRLGITLYSGCLFKESGKGCRFCNIDLSAHYRSRYLLTASEAVDLVEKGMLYRDSGIKHILLSGGVLPGKEYGAQVFAESAAAIKSKYPQLSIYAMMPPPKDNSTLQKLIDSGVDEIALNIEIFDGDMRKKLAPSKDEIGISRYFNALEYLSCHLPKFGARSILMGGIEPITSTLDGVEELCKRGVMPILSHYRSLGNTIQSCFQNENEIYGLWESAAEIADKHKMVIGPTCIPCQNNVIALPNGSEFKYY